MTPTLADLDRAERILRGIDPQTPDSIAWARRVAYRSLDYKLVALADLHITGRAHRWPRAATVALSLAGIILAWWGMP